MFLQGAYIRIEERRIALHNGMQMLENYLSLEQAAPKGSMQTLLLSVCGDHRSEEAAHRGGAAELDFAWKDVNIAQRHVVRGESDGGHFVCRSSYWS